MKSVSRISGPDLNRLIAVLDVQVVGLSECLVSPGYNLVLGGHEFPGIHYVLEGTGWMYVRNDPPVKVEPHTLVILPPNCPFRLEVINDGGQPGSTAAINGADNMKLVDSIRRFTAGNAGPQTVMICGFFKTLYGSSMDLFETLSAPIIENFCAGDQLDAKLKIAMAELMSQEIGSGAMTGALLKQVIVALVRKSLSSMKVWVERFSMLSDPQIAHAFADMVAQPGKAHTVHTLAETACLSRSAFMVRFNNAIGRSPMMVLRDLRMRLAATDLAAGSLSMDHVIRNSGYASRSSFARAFKEAYGVDPSSYRESTLASKGA
ncbi:AraC family transcriptional regulator [Massilia solisilvae]|uniref:AraC family transcriptional regulator n=1 Tax=Massilia solisilvae TaxID=1811225 RepID=A0ABT2BLT2_9BURK|nr:AraC family transcriptional regulator [Massilia solisilvae]MCS0609361.1 AraC family transcriptional regulator [Massilia solisilvae]